MIRSLVVVLVFASLGCRDDLSRSASAATPARGAAAPVSAPRSSMPTQGTVVFLGDSITWQHHYTAMVEQHFRRRHPERALRFFNRGLRGDTADGAIERFARDVEPLEPDLIVVMLGMNDGGYKGFNRGLLRRWRHYIGQLLQHARRRTGAAVILVTSTCVDARDARGREYNRMLGEMARQAVEVATAAGVPVVDLFAAFSAKLEQARRADPPLSLMADEIHPGPAGHLVIAAQLLDVLDPALAAGTSTIEARPIARSEGSWRVTFKHPHRNSHVPPEARPALGLVSFQRRFNARLLRVPGLGGRLRLNYGSRVLAEVDGAALARGIDLNTLDGAPWSEEAARLYELIRDRWRWQYALWDPRELGVEVLLDMRTSGLAPLRIDRAEAARRLERTLAEIDASTVRGRSYTLWLEQIGDGAGDLR